MLSLNSQEPSNEEMGKVLGGLYPDIPLAVHQADGMLGFHRNEDDVNRLTQRIAFELAKNDYHTLRSFNHESSERTWLCKIAMCQIVDLHREQKKAVSLEEMPANFFVAQADQEQRLISKERDERMLAAVGSLADRERELFLLWLEGTNPEEMAKRMGLALNTVYTMRCTVKRKLKDLLG
ncbi:MAG: sigma-70 family RNA polymerase sigma factor [Blastocatellia bacterium]